MTKTHKAVLSTLAVLCLLFMGSGVAQAQECIARGKSVMVRAEGITEAVGTIELRCSEPMGVLGFGSPDVLEITVELNTSITNRIMDDRKIVPAELEYILPMGAVRAAHFSAPMGDDDAEAATLSEDGTTITWKIPSKHLNLGMANDTGFQVTIGGIKANASTVGDGEDVTAVVSVGGGVVHSGSLKLADVTTGLKVKVEGADVLQCEAGDTEGATATITIQEAGFASSIVGTNEFVVSFIGIPEGVTVRVPKTETASKTPGVGEDDLTPEMAGAFGLELQETTRVSGATDDEDDSTMAIVNLNSSGSGEIVYNVIMGTTDDTLKEEWVKLMVTFSWEAGNVIDSGEVAVSFHPVSTAGGDTFDEHGAFAERYVASAAYTVIDVSPCQTTLLFPFVTNQQGFNTGLAITNASEGSGSCTIEYSGSDAPDDMTSQPVAGGAQWINLVSSVAPDFQGYVTASCEFRNAHGFAFITGGGPPATVAQGYLAVCTNCD
jgi:hypothetical protein